MTTAYRLLGIRAHTRAQLVKKLQAKGGSETDITAVLTELEQRGYVNDAGTAEGRIESILRQRPCGRLSLKARLRADGVPDETAQEALASVYPIEKEEAVAREALQRWLKAHINVTPEKQFAAAGRHLASRGFPEGLIYTVLAAEGLHQGSYAGVNEGVENM